MSTEYTPFHITLHHKNNMQIVLEWCKLNGVTRIATPRGCEHYDTIHKKGGKVFCASQREVTFYDRATMMIFKLTHPEVIEYSYESYVSVSQPFADKDFRKGVLNRLSKKP